MTPFATFLFFFILFPLLIPVVVGGLLGKRSKTYLVFLGIVMLGLIFGTHLKELMSLFGYIIWQVVLLVVYKRVRKQSNTTPLFYGVILLAILPLFLVKASTLLPNLSLLGFLGISYITFRSVQVLIEIRDGVLKDIRLDQYLHFLLFFPTISSGPIDRFRRFNKDALSVPTKDEYRDLLYLGINKIFQGFLYKYIIGFYLHGVIWAPYVQEHRLLPLMVYMYVYSFYLFFDFAGYSLFAIGVSYILGFRVPENFNKPFLSRNIKDFWNRWHMSLSFWFRDFIFMRFVLLITKKKWIKNRLLTANLGYLVLFLTMGFWHGFMVHYILYGLYQAFLFIGFDWFERQNKTHKYWPNNRWIHGFSIFITFHFVCFGFLIFSGQLIPF